MTAGEIMTTAQTYRLKALTDLWTGDARGRPDRLITTGLLGSIRWWFEVVVRGLGGSACDPTHHQDNKPGPCPQSGRNPDDSGHHCVVCELFGCTDWARKFRFDVLDGDGKPQQNQIKAGQSFQLRFAPLRPIGEQEWALLDLTLRLIAEYGAIGGKTVYKPTEETTRQSEQHHQDFGLVRLVSRPNARAFTENELRSFVSQQRWRSLNHGSFGWASLDNFWYVGRRNLARQAPKKSDFNRVLGRKEDKSEKERNGKRVVRWSDLLHDNKDQTATWVAGRQRESKKVFSFKNPDSARRTFGFVQSADKLDKMRQRLKEEAWGDLGDGEFVTGGEILRRLLREGGRG